MQHKWHKEIKAWADGAEIEAMNNLSAIKFWSIDHNPYWDNEDCDFRIKPQPKKPQYLYVYEDSNGCSVSLGKEKWETMYGSKYIGKIKLEQDDA